MTSSLHYLIESLKFRMESMSMASSPSWTGYYVADPRGQQEPIMQPAIGFPFRTAAAAKVWQEIQKVYSKYPQAKINELIKMGMDNSNVNMMELTPEDGRLLELVTDWLVTGKSANTVQGTPDLRTHTNGGEEGHILARRGYP